MGFVIAGYPTRRRRGQRHRELKLVIYGNAKKRRKIATDSSHGRRGSLSEMPVEIIQRIFVLSGNAAMSELNRFFHVVLLPTNFLLSNVIWENYVWDPVQNGIFGRDEDGDEENENRILLMLDNVFDVSVIRQYVGSNCDVLDAISRFIPVSLYAEFMGGGSDSDKIIEWWRQDAPMDFPRAIYGDMGLFVYDTRLVKSLSKFFILKDPYGLIEELICWFYRGNNGNNEEEVLFAAVRLILEVARVEDGSIHSSEPLESLIRVLFIENKNKNGVRTLTKFLKLFYSREDAQEHLSHTSLWQLLRSTCNMTIIDIVVHHGGRPNYGAFLVHN